MTGQQQVILKAATSFDELIVDEGQDFQEGWAENLLRFLRPGGSFASEADAENRKAQLALTGHEAAVQQATVPDKGVRYRVRLGPFDNSDEVNRVKSDLAKRGIDSAVIR